MKTLSIAFAALIVMAIGAQAADSVTSVNIVGYNSLTLEAGKRYIVSAPLYDPAGDGTNTLASVFGQDQLVQAANYANADRVILFDTVAGLYQSYAQYDGDGNFYKCNSAAEWEDINAVAQNDKALEVGGSFWIVHPAAEADSEISLLGEVLGGASDTQAVAIVTGYQLMSYAYAADVAIQDLEFDGVTAAANYANADRIVVWQSDTQSYQTYGLYDGDNKWYKCNSAAEWEDINAVPTTREISLAEGFWYISKSDFTWSEVCPYSQAY